jgi:hypothetical protein
LSYAYRRERVPTRIREGAAVVAVNVGGAVVPVALAGYLIVHDRLGAGVGWASLVVTVVVFGRPEVGILIPRFSRRPSPHWRRFCSAVRTSPRSTECWPRSEPTRVGLRGARIDR